MGRQKQKEREIKRAAASCKSLAKHFFPTIAKSAKSSESDGIVTSSTITPILPDGACASKPGVEDTPEDKTSRQKLTNFPRTGAQQRHRSSY